MYYSPLGLIIETLEYVVGFSLSNEQNNDIQFFNNLTALNFDYVFFLDLNWGTLRKLVSGMETKPLLITATDGNHGYALAFAAKLLGCEVFKI